ncbi:transglycosylase domain-containing protein [Streptomyces gobiensis]|uniref:transglycosylase domain-containing protein n=1 Tax=Streptomyces gobiensis TaxID=2875706 RepID=UPI001E5F409E|nr:transglycosylase domain-containing protein [Streptomyces gobiensis]UGY91615.1 transglycosylase domain-containing protein [Streptomyces gobiensis]
MSDESKSGERRPQRTGVRRLLPTWRMVLGGVLLFLLLVSGALVAGYLLVNIPEPNKAAAAQSNVYLYSDGTQIAKDGKVNRENISLAQVPKTAQHAVLAAEDRDFYNESAVDPKAMARAAWNMIRGEGKQSGSTITQQYVKNYYLSQERTVTRKAKEFFIAVKLDREVSKNDILRGYLNTSYFGRNAYGIQAAAQAYYGKKSEDLTTAEGAYLAALVNSPSAYDVSAHPENRKKVIARWNYVLDGMVKQGWLEKSERAGMKFPEPRTAKAPTGLSGQRGYLVEAVRNHLISQDIVDEQRLASGGFRITTTIDPDKQDAMESAVKDQLMSKLSDDREADRYVRVGGTSIDPETGKVVAMYGGIDYTKQYVNNATRRDYQAASTFKPFVYTSAIQNGSRTQYGQKIGPYTIYDGTSKRRVISDGRPTEWAPQNEGDVDHGKVSVTEAMDKSVNSVFAQMGVDVGPQKVKDTVVQLGIPAETPELDKAQSSIALGTATPSTLDLAQAYATLANHGERGRYSLVEKVSRGGEEIKLPGRDTQQAVPREAADATTAMLRSVVRSGTGTEAQTAGRPAAGKTGTAEDDQAAWFAGYTPDLATVIAVMGQDPETGAHKSLYGAAGQPKISGGHYPARIWGQYTAAALKGSPVKKFDLETSDGSPSLEPSTPETTPSASDEQSPPPASSSPPATGGTDSGGADNRGPDSGGTDSGGPTDGGTSTGGTDHGGTDTGGTETGGTTGGDNGGTGDSDSGGTDTSGGITEGGDTAGPEGGTGTPSDDSTGETSGQPPWEGSSRW